MLIYIPIDTSSRTFKYTFVLSLFILAVTLFSIVAYSWTGPTGSPPNNNTAAPVNVGATSQIKDGALSVNGFLNVGASSLQGAVNMNSNRINNLANPSAAQDAATKSYVDSVSGGSSGSYGASTWTAYAGLFSETVCPAGQVMTGVQMRNTAGIGITAIRVRCTVLTP